MCQLISTITELRTDGNTGRNNRWALSKTFDDQTAKSCDLGTQFSASTDSAPLIQVLNCSGENGGAGDRGKDGVHVVYLTLLHHNHVCCLTTMTPGRCCWSAVRCCVDCGELWNWRNGFISTLSRRWATCVWVGGVTGLLCMVRAKGTSWAGSSITLFERRCCWPHRGEGSSLNRWSPSRCRIASTIVSRFCRDVLAKYSLMKTVPLFTWINAED